ncbi:hypothetical protein HanIR_Chr09g0441901 [Helianthus annuus]|nr:hypothetical protein HanIR_Chr09g0441901 [Helianthus annuus]
MKTDNNSLLIADSSLVVVGGSYRGGGRGGGGSYRGRGGDSGQPQQQRNINNSSSRSATQQQSGSWTNQPNNSNNSRRSTGPTGLWPNWWMAQSPAPWYPPPPCPYPTLHGWASPWPQGYGPNHNNQAQPSSAQTPQAHLTEVNPLDPQALGDAFQVLNVQESDDWDDPWDMDTGATNHVTGDQGLQEWEDPDQA